MKKNKMIQTTKIIVLGLILSLGVDYVFSAPIILNPIPPVNNVYGPINVGPSIQIKNGDLSVNGFLGTLNAAFLKNVGIGMTTPTWPLQVKTSITDSSPQAFFENGSSEGLEIRHTGNNGGYGVVNSILLSSIKESGGIFRPLAFATSNVVRMFIDINGQVGVGTIAPKTKLDVNGAVKFGNQTVATLCNAMTFGSQRYNSVSNVMEFCSNNSTWIPISTFGGTYTVYAQTAGGHTAGDCFTGNPLHNNTCACPSGFSSYTMAEYTFISSPGNYLPYFLKGCHN